MKKNTIINLVYSFDEFKSFIMDMVGTAHDVAVNNIVIDPDLKTITIVGTEDKSATRRHSVDLPLDELLGVKQETPKVKKPHNKQGIAAYVREAFKEPGVRMPYATLKQLLSRDGFAQGRTDTQIKAAIYAAGIRQLDEGIYGFPPNRRQLKTA
jgi:hypothetical protein